MSREELPPAVGRCLDAYGAGDTAAAAAYFAGDATVVDDGRTYTGTDSITAWLGTSATEWTYTMTPTAFRRTGDEQYEITQHVVGDFPGGVVDLRWRFALRDGLIARLVIEP
ncbi:hypothetical protein DB35_28890 [Streptomyces abyssalis]|uniref:SnoaL-like domain-containing protein n=1 Tax=Streptomyces abyssalis TaxID=933944 RepID=A0A1E7JLT6_9ACTN|nr:hypothetical protein DB35_28890 [Streptomyces abyssalis]OEU88579.1 hypothetical protein AN215_16945 [Streptomyces abyssalis]OEV30195.1 hypothetical protein AN219_12290 [Streptomyces nanshensis]